MKEQDPEGLMPQLAPFSVCEARLLAHLALVLGLKRLGADESDATPLSLLRVWFPWYTRLGKEEGKAVESLDRQFQGASSSAFCRVWRQIRQAVKDGQLNANVATLSGYGASGLDMLTSHCATQARADQADWTGEERGAALALQRNATPLLVWTLLADQYDPVRGGVFPLLLFLSRHRMHTHSRTVWQAAGIEPEEVPAEGGPAADPNAIRDMDVVSLLRLVRGVQLPPPDKLPVCAAMVMVVRELAEALLKDQRLLQSPSYRRLLWASVDAVLWYAAIRGLFAKVKPEYAHLPITTRPPADKYLWLIAEFGYVVLGIHRDLRVHEHFRRAMQHEVLLYHSRTEYRDHLFHAIDTFLTGYFLLTAHDGPLGPVFSRTGDKPRKTLREWFLAALFHDFGYVMELVPLTLKLAREFPLASTRRLVSDLGDKWNNRVTDLNRALQEQQGLVSEIGRNRTDHGVFSYLHLCKELLRLDPVVRENVDMSGPPADSDSEHCKEHAAALLAILKHNLECEPVDLHKEPLSALLILCDELQEWQRPRYSAWGLALSSVEAIQDQELPESSGRRVCEAMEFEGCTSSGAGILFSSQVPKILFRYSDQNLNRFDPITRLLRKIHNLERIEGLQDIRLLLEVQIRRLPRKPLPGESERSGPAEAGESELDILRDFCVLREVGLSAELFTRRTLTETSKGRCICYEVTDGPQPLDMVRLDLRGFTRKARRKSPLVRIPPWDFEKRLLEFKREYCRRKGVYCTLFSDDEEWPEQQIIKV